MGIPKFFKWLTRRYPQVLLDVKREEQVPPIDNLYLDLNGIVHNCIHGNDAKLHERVSQLDSFEEVWMNIMKTIDELVHTIKPRKLLFLAVDGVAPRAKMNQQRARRFRSAKDSTLLKEKFQKEGKQAPELFDSNAISPGTKFMSELSKHLDFFVQYKQNTDPLYQNLERIILSDGAVPGEGEHKMMDFIRQARFDSSYDTSTRHCFYGADADLIMLSLMTHEPNFIILREEHVIRKIKQGGVQRLDLKRTNNYQIIFINLLREYFLLEYRSIAPRMKMRFDLERIIDDFIFFCFFIGNDFLPSLSALDIGEGSLDSIIDLYKRLLPSMENYITEEGKIYWNRAEPFIKMLGEHEHESFKNRVSKIGAMRDERIISFDTEMSQSHGTVDRNQLIKQRIREKLNEKKRKKILGLCQKKKDMQTKKFLLMKRFEEDEISQSMSMRQRQLRDLALLKYQVLRDKQNQDQNVQSQGVPISEETKQVESLKEIISNLKEEYFSDLNIDDIDDDEVSEISESEMDLTNLQETNMNSDMEKKVQISIDIQDKYEQQNFEFMQEFIKIYQTDPEAAKAMYYRAKLKFDISQIEGKSSKRKMLMKYLEGLQWVLYYYYKGAQHWRWYYPYHYAPMISDLEENIANSFLGGKTFIDQFEIDDNCADINLPYTPFQQLLSILPTKSLHLLPSQYSKIVLGDLRSYFPDDFDIDLNGRTLTYEAACLIPFCEEKLFIDQETTLLSENTLAEEDQVRNTSTFEYKCYTYDHLFKQNQVLRPMPLDSPLPSFKGLEFNYVKITLLNEYQNVGKFSFESKLLKNAKTSTDFPSFTHLNIQEVTYDEKVMHEVSFQRVLLRIPQTKEDISTEYLESYTNQLVKVVSKEIYIDFPFQYEAFPTFFQNKEYTYTLYGDDVTNVYKIHKDRQGMDQEKFDMMAKRSTFKLQDMGFQIDEKSQTFVSFNRVTDVSFDFRTNQYYKVYSNDQELLPLCMLTRRRDPYHFQNINARCSNLLMSFKPNNQVVCLNTNYFGVIGKVKQIDMKNKQISVAFDKREEQSKIHDPFMGQKCLQNKTDSTFAIPLQTKRYYSDKMIEQMLKLKYGVVNRITGSLLVTFNDRQKWERQVIDLGLNLKNYTKKAHIPDFVRYVVDEEVADNQFDQDYIHNQHSRGAKHQRKHWEYSEECLEIIKEYRDRYYFVFDVINKTMRSNKSMLSLKDIFGKSQGDEQQNQQLVKEVANWIEQLPTSNLPYVEMGFDALNQDLIQIINDHSKLIRETYRKVQLKCKEVEVLDPSYLFQEQFPFWSLPFNGRSVNDYRIGDRVMSVKSVMREYVPFGFRGTVVGKTNDKIIIMFDEQYLGGNNIYGHCENYRGGFLDPNYLINLTKRFNSIMNSNQRVAQSFQERPVVEGDQQQQFEEQDTQINETLNPDEEESKDSDPSKNWTDVGQKPRVVRNQKPADQVISQRPSDFPVKQKQQRERQMQQNTQASQHQDNLRQQYQKKQARNPNQQPPKQYFVPKQSLNYQERPKPQFQVQQQKPASMTQNQTLQQDPQQVAQLLAELEQQLKIHNSTANFQAQIPHDQVSNANNDNDIAQIDDAIISTTTQQQQQDQKEQQQQILTAFVPSQNQMKDYFYDDDYDQEADDYYGEQYQQEDIKDQRVNEEAELFDKQAQNILNNLKNNQDFQQLLNMMNVAQQIQNPINLFGNNQATVGGGFSFGGFADAPNPFSFNFNTNTTGQESNQQQQQEQQFQTPLNPNAQPFTFKPTGAVAQTQDNQQQDTESGINQKDQSSSSTNQDHQQ